jgi:hypothetical protein
MPLVEASRISAKPIHPIPLPPQKALKAVLSADSIESFEAIAEQNVGIELGAPRLLDNCSVIPTTFGAPNTSQVAVNPPSAACVSCVDVTLV